MAPDTAKTPKQTMTSRAVMRNIEAGSTVECVECRERVKFQAKVKMQQVICNVYVDGQWDRVEHFHRECYEGAGEPHGPASLEEPRARRSRSA